MTNKDFYSAIENRRSYYGISSEAVVSNERIQEVINHAVKHTLHHLIHNQQEWLC